ncbi:TPA: helix-turn-helix domain-containing protein [Pseudomonas aeruginosa]|nr:Hin recombinase [Pseudomonas aeruginosa]
MGSTPFAAVVHSASDIWRSRLLKTTAGLEVAKQLGRKGGRKPKMTDSKIESAKKLLASGVPPKDVAKNLGVSIPTLYRWVPASTHA